jgi:sporulation protein YlmC with PRC-barrel domain
LKRRYSVLHKVTELRGDKIAAKDGEIGRVEQVYFDDESWRVRYFVVNTGGWLSRRKVLISPAFVDRSKSSEEALTVGLTRDQVQQSPEVDADKPVDRQYEEAYARYYGIPLYWAPPGEAGLSTVQRSAERARKLEEAKSKASESHLRSSDEVIGYSIQASDGKIGHVEDLRIDDGNWAIADLVVDTRDWLAGRKVLVPQSAIQDIDWNTKQLRLRMSRRDVEQACPAP